MKTRAFSALLAAILLISLLAGCGAEPKPDATVTTGEVGVVKDEEFGSVYVDGTIEEFNALGFAFGDSVDISFDNGKHFEDVPYYSGYYAPVGSLLLCGYPGYPHVVVAYNYGESTWEGFGMTESSKVTVTLREAGKYRDVQESFALSYSDERADFDSDITFANFRAVKGGALREGAFYRSASPCDNRHLRAACTNRLVEEAGIGYVLNLSDSEEKYLGYTAAEDFDSAYYDALYKDGKVLFLGLNANYRADGFAKAVSEAFAAMSEQTAPCLIHCVEGKDRTGFVCALLLALADATAEEIYDDYMITYDNYYHVTKESDPAKYEAISGNVRDFLYCLCEAEDGTAVETLDLKAGAESYLRRGGLSDEQIAQIEAYIR